MMKQRFILTAFVAFLAAMTLAAGGATAQLDKPSFDDAIAAFNYGDNDLALRHFSRLANENDARAQYYYAYMLDAGLGTGQNIASAAGWYKKSAQQDYLPAIVYLGYIYSIGHGLAKDEKEAFKWYTRGAQMGDAIAQNNLATMLQRGIPYKPNLPLAAQWFLQSAMQGNMRAQYNLATMYRLGDGIKKNPCEAMRWYKFAANQGDMYAQNALAYMYRMGECVEKPDMEQAVEWLRRAAEQGHTRSQMALAVLYEIGEAGDNYTLDDALPWYFRAANEGGDEKAMYRLGWLYERGPDAKTGRGLPVDDKEALKWYQKAADVQYAPAIFAMGNFHYEGRGGLKKDQRKGREFYLTAANMGDPLGMAKLARISKYGLPPLSRANKIDAMVWYELAKREIQKRGDTDSEEMLSIQGEIVKEQLDLRRNMSPGEIEQAQRRVDSWYPVLRPKQEDRSKQLYWDEGKK